MAKHGEHGSGNLVCSFCGKSQDEVRKLIAGPTVYICDECIDLCNDIIAEECDHDETLSSSSNVPKPPEIKRVLDELKAQDFAGNISIEYEYNWDNNVVDAKECVDFIKNYGQ